MFLESRMNQSKKFFIPLIALIVVILIGLIFYLNKSHFEEVSPKRADVIEAVFGMGKVKARDKFDVKIGILTKVLRVYVREGDSVERGETLISFETGAPYKSPINGHVTLVNINAGETALPQVPLIKVENLENLYIEVSLEQSSALKVKRDQVAKITFHDSNFGVIQGRVESIYPREEEFLVVINTATLPQAVLPGMSADVSIIVGTHQDSLLIPARALENDRVERIRDGQSSTIKVKVGTSQGVWLQILEGDLKESDKLKVLHKD